MGVFLGIPNKIIANEYPHHGKMRNLIKIFSLTYPIEGAAYLRSVRYLEEICRLSVLCIMPIYSLALK